jgi:HSP20 family protein
MATTMARVRPGLVPFDWAGMSWFPLFAPSIKVEDFIADETYVVRAELPGIDPTNDVEVTCVDRALRLHVVRSDERKNKAHSEFHYGSFFRSIPLPVGADEENISARYADGILEVTVPIVAAAPAGRTIPVHVGEATKPVNGKKH